MYKYTFNYTKCLDVNIVQSSPCVATPRLTSISRFMLPQGQWDATGPLWWFIVTLWPTRQDGTKREACIWLISVCLFIPLYVNFSVRLYLTYLAFPYYGIRFILILTSCTNLIADCIIMLTICIPWTRFLTQKHQLFMSKISFLCDKTSKSNFVIV